MPFLDKLPILNKCCGCVTDLKTAVAIIGVLAIVTSPLASWAIVRHVYVIRVACDVSTRYLRPDVVDINFNNALSFGFGTNAGLGASCFVPNITDTTDAQKGLFGYVKFVKNSGWIILIADVILLCASFIFLLRLYRGDNKMATKVFMISAFISTILTFIYGLLYISICITMGGKFPILELFFALIDFIMWLYFLIVVNSYRRHPTKKDRKAMWCEDLVVRNCCFSINLKLGSVLICVFALLSNSSYALLGNDCYVALQRVIISIIICLDILLTIAAIVFLIGILIDKQITAIIFLHAMALTVIAKLILSIVGHIIASLDGTNYDCHTYYSLAVNIIFTLVMIYFMIVVRSYKDEMED